jgi:23S rRNA pseudouridine1911/1915/1917 synthase
MTTRDAASIAFVASALDGLSRTQVQAVERGGAILVDGRVSARTATRSSAGEQVEVGDGSSLGARARSRSAQRDSRSVIHEDESIVVSTSPRGWWYIPRMATGTARWSTRCSGAGPRSPRLGSGDRPGVVHRLDKDTSGVIVLAKTDARIESLAAQFKEKQTEKIYHALVHGHVRARSIIVEEAIARHPVHRQRMAVSPRAGERRARTSSW